ncbi:MAG: demethoxyubiquinone hydroxylase family protein [Pelagibacterales bacterium]|nr:demethoxyubiquinone hydroxylase family protein [Pelagibacterales bacterium]
MDFEKKLHEIIRVDHAGEFGAKVIYNGQIVALKLKKDEETLKLVEHMKKQEDVHFDYFNEEIKKHKIRPTVLHPVWKLGGFALGFLTAIIDKKAAMVCTTAVEETIDKHYQEQIEFLEKSEQNQVNQINLENLKNKIQKFRDEELEHRDIAYENKAAEFSAYTPLSALIKSTVKVAITLSKKI